MSSTGWLSSVKRKRSKEHPQITDTTRPLKSSRLMTINYQQLNLKQYFSQVAKEGSHETGKLSVSKISSSSVTEPTIVQPSKNKELRKRTTDDLHLMRVERAKTLRPEIKITNDAKQTGLLRENSQPNVVISEKHKLKNDENNKQKANTTANEKWETKTTSNDIQEAKTTANDIEETKTMANEKQEAYSVANEKQEVENYASQRGFILPAASSSQSQEHLWDSLSLNTGPLVPFKPLSPFGTELVLETPPMFDDITKPTETKENNYTLCSLTLDSQMPIQPFVPLDICTEFTLDGLR